MAMVEATASGASRRCSLLLAELIYHSWLAHCSVLLLLQAEQAQTPLMLIFH